MATGDDLAALLNHAPELQQSPGLTVGLSQGIQASGAPVDPAQIGQSASIALTGQGIQQANEDIVASADPVTQQQHHGGGGILGAIGHFAGSVVHDVEHPVSTFHSAEHGFVNDVVHPVTSVLNAGLNEVTHTYRYIHDVWERHGVLAALQEIGTIAGAGALVGIGVATSPFDFGASLGVAAVGAGVLAGELAGDATARIEHPDSWKATDDSAYVDKQGYKVSPGRDFARLLGHIVPGFDVGHNAQGDVTGTGAGFVSGAGDATFDLAFDPTLKLGTLVKTARVAARVPRLAASWEEIRGADKLDLSARPLVEQNGIKPNNVQVLFRNNPGVSDAFNRIARMDTKQILSQYPQLPSGVIKALSQAHTGQDVADVFEQSLTAYNYSFRKYGLPTTSLTRRLLGGVGLDVPTPAGISTAIQSKYSRQAVDSEGNPIFFHQDGMPTQIPIMTPSGVIGHTINAFTAYQPFAFNSKTLELSAKSGDPMDPEFVRGLYSVLRYSQNTATAKSILARYVDADTLGERINIITNAYRDALRASGLPDTHDFAGKVVGDLDFLTKQALHGRLYAVGRDGKRIALTDESGNVINRGVWVNQTGKVAFPDFNVWRRAVAETKGGLWARAIHMDDWMNRNLTTRFFKRLVLLCGGFALRVSAGELIPASLSEGGRKVLAGGLAAAAAKLNPDVSEIMETVSRGAGEHPLIGARAATRGVRHIGIIKDFDPATGEVHISFGGETPSAVSAKSVTVFHRDIEDEEIRKAASNLGVSFTTEDVPHIRAAVGKALWGVGKAFIDPTYREVALMNILANDGHIVAPGIASLDYEPRGHLPMNEEVRKQATRVGINLPHNVGLGKDFRLWD